MGNEEDVIDSIDVQEQKDIMGDHDDDDEIEAVYATEHGATVTDVLKRRLNKQFKPQGVEIVDVIIEHISLPSSIQSQMSQKTMVISQNAEQRMQQKHDLLVLEQDEAIITLRQSHAEQKLEMIKDGKQKASVMNLELEHERSLGKASLRRIVTNGNVDVSLTNSESALTVQRIYYDSLLEEKRIKFEAEEKSTILDANTSAKTRDIDAKADLKCAELQASADLMVFKAEGESASKMKTFNDHHTNMQKIGVQESLAQNEKLVVTGISGGNAANRLVLADAALKAIKENPNSTYDISTAERSTILSELAVASGKAEVRINVGNHDN